MDQSIDIYAFGIVMWEVFTRKPPYSKFAPDFEVRTAGLYVIGAGSGEG